MNPGRTALRWGAAGWLALFALSLAGALLSRQLLQPGEEVAPPGYRPPRFAGIGAVVPGSFLKADALWYLKISEQGYNDAGTFAFLPVFPLLIRALSPLLGTGVSAFVIANLACIAGLVLTFAFVETIAGIGGAKAATIGLALFPTAFFLVAPYAEPVFLGCAAGALLAAAKGRYLVAAGLGALAALTRPFGVLLMVPLLVIPTTRKPSRWLPAAGPLLGAAAWIAWVGMRTGNVLDAVKVQSIWQRSAQWPFISVVDAVKSAAAMRSSPLLPYFLYDLIGLLVLAGLIVGTAVVVRNRSGVGLAIYGAAVLMIALTLPFPPRPLLSLPRFILALSPLFVAYRLIPRFAAIPTAVISGVGLVWATAQFVASRPIF